MKARADLHTHIGAELKWVIREGHQGNRQTQAIVRHAVLYTQEKESERKRQRH